MEYSIAHTDDLIRFWRSKVKVTAGLWASNASTSTAGRRSPSSIINLNSHRRILESHSVKYVYNAVDERCCSVSSTPAGLRVRPSGASAGQVRVPGEPDDRRDGVRFNGHGVADRRRSRTDGRRLNVRLRRRQTLGTGIVRSQLHVDNSTQTSGRDVERLKN